MVVPCATENLLQLMPQAAMVVDLTTGQIVRHNSMAVRCFGLQSGDTIQDICNKMGQGGALRVWSSVKADLERQEKSVLRHMEMKTGRPELEHYDIHISYVDSEKNGVFFIFALSLHELSRMAQQNNYFNTLSKAVYSYPFHLDVKERRMTLYDPELEKFNLPLSMDNFPEPVLVSGVLYEDDREIYLETVARMYRGDPPEGSFRFYDPQGQLLTYTINYVVNRDIQGEPLHINGDFIIKSEMKFEGSEQKVLLAHQIKAHFFFNTLNTISALCKQDAAKADSAIRTFATYMRSYMHLVNETAPIDFAQELTLVKSTLEIEKIRFPDSFVYELEVETKDFRIPPLSLQPLVENALLHGLRRTGHHGTLKISAKQVGSNIQVVVEDNGMGFDTQVLNQGKSVGLKNMTKRLQLMVGGSVTIHSTPGLGTQAITQIPLTKIPTTRW